MFCSFEYTVWFEPNFSCLWFHLAITKLISGRLISAITFNLSSPHSSVILSVVLRSLEQSLAPQQEPLSLQNPIGCVLHQQTQAQLPPKTQGTQTDASHQQVYRRSHVACWVQRSVKSRAMSCVVTNHKIKESIKRPCYTLTALAKANYFPTVATMTKRIVKWNEQNKQRTGRRDASVCLLSAVQNGDEIIVYFCHAVDTLRNLSCKWNHVTCVPQERLTSKRGSGTEKMKEKEEGSEVKAENVSVEMSFLNKVMQQLLLRSCEC